jgi:hypothetical protein
LFVFCCVAPTCLWSETISGTIQDPSGALIPGAQIEVTGGGLSQALVISSDGQGKFRGPRS